MPLQVYVLYSSLSSFFFPNGICEALLLPYPLAAMSTGRGTAHGAAGGEAALGADEANQAEIEMGAAKRRRMDHSDHVSSRGDEIRAIILQYPQCIPQLREALVVMGFLHPLDMDVKDAALLAHMRAVESPAGVAVVNAPSPSTTNATAPASARGGQNRLNPDASQFLGAKTEATGEVPLGSHLQFARDARNASRPLTSASSVAPNASTYSWSQYTGVILDVRAKSLDGEVARQADDHIRLLQWVVQWTPEEWRRMIEAGEWLHLDWAAWWFHKWDMARRKSDRLEAMAASYHLVFGEIPSREFASRRGSPRGDDSTRQGDVERFA